MGGTAVEDLARKIPAAAAGYEPSTRIAERFEIAAGRDASALVSDGAAACRDEALDLAIVEVGEVLAERLSFRFNRQRRLAAEVLLASTVRVNYDRGRRILGSHAKNEPYSETHDRAVAIAKRLADLVLDRPGLAWTGSAIASAGRQLRTVDPEAITLVATIKTEAADNAVVASEGKRKALTAMEPEALFVVASVAGLTLAAAEHDFLVGPLRSTRRRGRFGATSSRIGR